MKFALTLLDYYENTAQNDHLPVAKFSLFKWTFMVFIFDHFHRMSLVIGERPGKSNEPFSEKNCQDPLSLSLSSRK